MPFVKSSTKRQAFVLVLALGCALLVACTSGPAFTYHLPDQPEGAGGASEKPGWATTRFAVAAANPLATDAGYQVLKAGGSAIDAAIAVQMVLTLVEPQSSGIGGGSFVMHFDGQRVQAFDGRETAPAAAHESLFLASDGKPIAMADAVVGGRSVGTPGTVAVLEMAHRQHGKLPWARLIEPAIQLAQQGFKVSPRLNELLLAETHLKKDPVAARYFYNPDGSPRRVGFVLKNPALAQALQSIADRGSAALRTGPIAEAIVRKVQQHPTNPGTLSMADLADYQAVERAPLCFDYQAEQPGHQGPGHSYRLCGFPPPSSGAIAIGQILGLLRHTRAAQLPLQDGLPSAPWLHFYTEAARLAFADRSQYLADPAFVDAPASNWLSLLNPSYLAQRAKLIGQADDAASMRTARPGDPGPVDALKTSYAPMPDQPEYGTSHVSIVDGFGNALAMTSTIEAGFGSRQMVAADPSLAGGFLLNNELTDFSFLPADANGKPIANRVQPGKRPRSSMSPTLVFDAANGQFVMSAGSPGGAMIIHFTAKVLYGVLNWGLLPQQAINLPNFGSLNGPTILEAKRFTQATVDSLEARGHQPQQVDLTSGLQAITAGQVHGQRLWLGGADPRREGIVMGD